MASLFRRWYAAAVAVAVTVTGVDAKLTFTGVNSAAAEFGEQVLPGVLNVDYRWPDETTYTYFASRNMNIIRLPFLWERLQPTLNAAFDATYSAALTYHVDKILAAGHTVLVDPHNYARYRSQLIGSAAVPDTAFVDFWQRLAALLPQPKVIYGLMNEPNTMPTNQWFQSAQKALNAIRAAGRTNLIFVPGNAWTGAHSWLNANACDGCGTANSVAALTITDPGNNFAFEVHQYFDADYSGRVETCPSTDGAARFTALTNWLRQNGKRAFLGEFGAGSSANCQAAITSALQHLQTNSDVYLGYTWWAAGPWWTGYFQSLEPGAGNVDKPQMAWLLPFNNGDPTASPPPSTATTNPPNGQSTAAPPAGTNSVAAGQNFPATITNTNAGGSFSVPITYTSSSAKTINVDILSSVDNMWYGKGTMAVGMATTPTTVQITVTIQTALPASKSFYLHGFIVDTATYNADPANAYLQAVAQTDNIPIGINGNTLPPTTQLPTQPPTSSGPGPTTTTTTTTAPTAATSKPRPTVNGATPATTTTVTASIALLMAVLVAMLSA